MKIPYLTLTLIAIFANICVSAQAAPVVRPSDVNTNPTAYDSKTVVLIGTLFFSFPAHSRFIYDSFDIAKREWRYREYHSDFNTFDFDKFIKYCISIANPENIPHRFYGKAVNVRVIGRIIADNIDAYYSVGTCGGNTAIEVEKIVDSW